MKAAKNFTSNSAQSVVSSKNIYSAKDHKMSELSINTTIIVLWNAVFSKAHNKYSIYSLICLCYEKCIFEH